MSLNRVQLNGGSGPTKYMVSDDCHDEKVVTTQWIEWLVVRWELIPIEEDLILMEKRWA